MDIIVIQRSDIRHMYKFQMTNILKEAKRKGLVGKFAPAITYNEINNMHLRESAYLIGYIHGKMDKIKGDKSIEAAESEAEKWEKSYDSIRVEYNELKSLIKRVMQIANRPE